MAQDAPPVERPVTPPPPLPSRSPLRGDPLYQQKRGFFQDKAANHSSPSSTDHSAPASVNHSGPPLSPSSQNIFEEIDLELEDTRQRLVSAIYKIKGMFDGLGETESLNGEVLVCDGTIGAKKGLEGECTVVELLSDEPESHTDMHGGIHSASEGPRDGLKEDLYADMSRWLKSSSVYSQHTNENHEEKLPPSEDLPSRLNRWSKYSSVYSQLVQNDGAAEVASKDQKARQRTSALQGEDDLEADLSTTATILSYDGVAPSSRGSVADDENARVEAWLARGRQNSEAQVAEQVKRLSGDWHRIYYAKHPALSPFPPTSPTTDQTEYAPLISSLARSAYLTSPMNNGRDAYGNYISSKTLDYFDTQSPPTSPVLSSLSQHQPYSKQGRQQPPVSLRGGWDLPKTLWSRTGEKKPRQDDRAAPEPGKRDRSNSQDSRSKRNSWQRTASRAVPSLLSQYSTTSTTASTKVDKPRHAHLSGPPDANSLDDVNKVLDTYFGVRNLKPGGLTTSDTGPATLPEIDNGCQDLPPRHVPPFPPSDVSVVPLNKQIAPQTYGHPIYCPETPFAPQDPEKHAKPLEPWRSEQIALGSSISAGNNQRWDRALPPDPPRKAMLSSLEAAESLHRYSGSDQDDRSIVSAAEIDLKSIKTVDMNDLDRALFKSGPYRDIRERFREQREAERLMEEARQRREEQERKEQLLREQAEERQRRLVPIRLPPPPHSTIGTLRPEDSVSQISGQGRIQGHFRRGELRPLREQGTRHSSQKHRSYIDVESRRVREGGRPRAIPTIAPAPTLTTVTETSRADRPNMNSIEMAFHIAGKVTRCLLAAPSNPKYKTYSRRHPPLEARQDGNVPSRPNTGGRSTIAPLPGMSDIHPTQTMHPTAEKSNDQRGRQTSTKIDKGKDKAIDVGGTTDRRDFAPNLNQECTFSVTTAVNTNTRPTGTTLSGPLNPRLPTTRLSIHRNASSTVSGGESAINTTPAYPPSGASTHETLWAVEDEQGNVTVPQRQKVPGLRGGSGGGLRGDVMSRFSSDSDEAWSEEGRQRIEKKTRLRGLGACGGYARFYEEVFVGLRGDGSVV